MVSVIAGFGSLNLHRPAASSFEWGCSPLRQGLALGLVFLLPLVFPAVETASFFSTSLVEERPPWISSPLHPDERISIPGRQRGARGRPLQRLPGHRSHRHREEGSSAFRAPGAGEGALACEPFRGKPHAHRALRHRRRHRGHDRHGSGGPPAGLHHRVRSHVAAPRLLDPARVGCLPDPDSGASHPSVDPGCVDYRLL